MEDAAENVADLWVQVWMFCVHDTCVGAHAHGRPRGNGTGDSDLEKGETGALSTLALRVLSALETLTFAWERRPTGEEVPIPPPHGCPTGGWGTGSLAQLL